MIGRSAAGEGAGEGNGPARPPGPGLNGPVLDATDASLVARCREGLVATRAHFNHAGASLVPAETLERMRTHLQLEAEIGGYEAAAQVAEELAGVPAAVAPLFGSAVEAGDVTVVESASRASEQMVWSMAETFGWGPDDRVLVDPFTYATVHATLMALRAARGVVVDVAPAGADGTVDARPAGLGPRRPHPPGGDHPRADPRGHG